MKGASLIRKNYKFSNIQILSKYELQIKYESVLALIQPKEILEDISFFEDLLVYFDASNVDKAFLTYKFTLYCYLLVGNQDNFFKGLFLKYVKIFIKACHKYYIFVIIKIHINSVFGKFKKKLSINEFNKVINSIIEEYKKNPYDNILKINIKNFVKDHFTKSLFQSFIESLKFPFDKDQIKAFSKYIIDNSYVIMNEILINEKSKISFFKKINNLIIYQIKEAPNIITNNNSKRKCISFYEDFFISIIDIYNEVINLLKKGYYNFYEKSFIINYIQNNLIITIMQFLEKKYFSISDAIVLKITKLFDSIEEYLLKNLKLDEKKYFIEYSWIMAHFFSFLYHSENKKQSIIYGNKIINLYKDKSFISRSIIFIKLTLYEFYLKNQKENLNEYDLDEHINNLSELITMFGKCEIESEVSEKNLLKMLHHLFGILFEHIIYIINNRPTRVKYIYKLLIIINPYMINCANNSNNKKIFKNETYFNIFYYLTNITVSSTKDSDINKEENIDIFFEDKNSLSQEEKNMYINIISFFSVYGKNNQEKIIKILKDLYDSNDEEHFLDVYFNILYQLEKSEKYNIDLLFNLLNILINFLEKKYENKTDEINEKFFSKYFNIYFIYVFNSLKYAYLSILKPNKIENISEKNNEIDEKYNEDGILIKISDSISLINKFIELHIKIFELIFIKDKIINIPYNQPAYNIHYAIYLNFFLELISIYSNKDALIFHQLYLISTSQNIFNDLKDESKNIIYYFLYRLLHNINGIIGNRDLNLIKGKSEISKNIKSILYNNAMTFYEQRKKSKNKNNQNDSFFYLEPLIEKIIGDISIDEDIIFENNLQKNFSFKTDLEKGVLQFINFKINFISDTNQLVEIIKLHYISGQEINSSYMQSYFNYYIPILKNKEFNSNFSLIINIFYLIKGIFLPNDKSKEKINFQILLKILKNQNTSSITKKNIIIRLLIKYMYNIKTINESKKKIDDVLILFRKELEELRKDKNLINNEQKTQKYLTYIELLSLEYFFEISNGTLSENNIDKLINKGKNLLIKCLELLKAFTNEKYIRQYYPNERHRLKAIHDFLFNELTEDDSLYLLNMDDYEFIFLQLLNKIYRLSEFLFNKMYSFGYGDSIIEIFHKFRVLTIIKYNKIYCSKIFGLLIKIMRKWKRKERYNISQDIGDFKNDEEYNNFINNSYKCYIKTKYPNFNFNMKDEFKIYEFIKEKNIENDFVLNKCLGLQNFNNNFNVKEISIFMKNMIKDLKKRNLFLDKNVSRLKKFFLEKFNINSSSSYYFANFLNIENKYIIKIIPLLFEKEIAENILMNEKTFNTIIDLLKSAYQTYNINNWNEYKYLKYCKKNIKHLIYISSYLNPNKEENTLKLINLYMSFFHNFKYNLSYKGNETNKYMIKKLNEEKCEANNEYNIQKNDMNMDLDENNKMENDKDEKNSLYEGIEGDKYKNINLISFFRINNYIYLYIKLREKFSYDIINVNEEKDFGLFFTDIKKIAANENSEQKIKKKLKNEEYRKALFTLQNLLIKHCPNFIKALKKYYESHINFIDYINTKINKYSLKITSKDVINWLFEETDIQLKTKKKMHYNTSKRIKLMSIDAYKNKFIKKFFYSNQFKFNFYDGNKEDIFYYIPSIELSKIPLENIPLLYNLAIIRTLSINYIKPEPIHKKIAIKKDIFCLLNPKSDLVDTEKKILPLLKQYEIKCINSKEPTEKEMESIVSNKLMYIYCGHGSSLKYLSTEYIESHKINFLTFLFGCSSASSRLLSEKDSQPLSTPQLFLKQLCPFFFGFLWPVSSSDLDELTVELFKALFENQGPNSLIKIITLLKRKFSLKWFNGGALVMYCNSDVLPEFEK